MKSDNVMKTKKCWDTSPQSTMKIEYVDDQNADFMANGSAAYAKTTEDLIYTQNSGKLEPLMKSWAGKRMAIFFFGEWPDLKESAVKILSLSQKHNIPVIAAIDRPTAWGLIERYLLGENVWIGDTSTITQPRLESVGGANGKDWSLSGLPGRLKIDSIKYIDVLAAVRDAHPYPDVIQESCKRFKYYGVYYLDQNIAQDRPTIADLKTACETNGAMFKTGNEKQLRSGLQDLATGLWKRFLSDIENQFDCGGK